MDFLHFLKYGREFNEYGVTIYCGRQGAGKTMAMVEYLERMRLKYPKAKIYTNFGYVYQTGQMESWHDLLSVKNGTDGIIWAIDEIQNEFSNAKWKDFPEFILREITQQRKQRVKIVCTSQVFSRVVKQIREQCFEVVECRTLLGRWTFCRAFDAEEYNAVIDNPDKKLKLRRLWRRNFIQTNSLRDCYDSYLKIDKLKTIEFLEREKRLV
jgi:ATP-dependent Clp protease ATP-binding subunit ClpX